MQPLASRPPRPLTDRREPRATPEKRGRRGSPASHALPPRGPSARSSQRPLGDFSPVTFSPESGAPVCRPESSLCQRE